jgi:hypothetical protein
VGTGEGNGQDSIPPAGFRGALLKKDAPSGSKNGIFSADEAKGMEAIFSSFIKSAPGQELVAKFGEEHVLGVLRDQYFLIGHVGSLPAKEYLANRYLEIGLDGVGSILLQAGLEAEKTEEGRLLIAIFGFARQTHDYEMFSARKELAYIIQEVAWMHPSIRAAELLKECFSGILSGGCEADIPAFSSLTRKYSIAEIKLLEILADAFDRIYKNGSTLDRLHNSGIFHFKMLGDTTRDSDLHRYADFKNDRDMGRLLAARAARPTHSANFTHRHGGRRPNAH